MEQVRRGRVSEQESNERECPDDRLWQNEIDIRLNAREGFCSNGDACDVDSGDDEIETYNHGLAVGSRDRAPDVLYYILACGPRSEAIRSR
jgi:hypothetical protein